MRKARLLEIGVDVVTLLGHYTNGPQREMLIDSTLYAYLRAAHSGPVRRQYPAHLPGAKKPPRIDFRLGGRTPVLIEFAVRPPRGGSQLHGAGNRPELCKLTRFPRSAAQLRALLLLDLAKRPIAQDALCASYKQINAGRGNFSRHPVQVLYVHKDDSYSFIWRTGAR